MRRAPGRLPPPGQITQLLEAWRQGDETARDRLIPVIYADLRRRASAQLRRERRDHTLAPSDLVHETYLRLSSQNAAWQNREQFFGVASRLMRRILVDHARARVAAKRGGGLRVSLSPNLAAADAVGPDLLDLDQALDELAAFDPRSAELVELRFFGGLAIDAAAAALGVSEATANRDWVTAKAWLHRRLKRVAR
jgi:RNA polymerase sigma factor (TIGR02999 family)